MSPILCSDGALAVLAAFLSAGVIWIRLFHFRGILGLLSAWNLCSITFGWGIDRLLFGLLRCITNEP